MMRDAVTGSYMYNQSLRNFHTYNPFISLLMSAFSGYSDIIPSLNSIAETFFLKIWTQYFDACSSSPFNIITSLIDVVR
jgi:hypothetical protein